MAKAVSPFRSGARHGLSQGPALEYGRQGVAAVAQHRAQGAGLDIGTGLARPIGGARGAGRQGQRPLQSRITSAKLIASAGRARA